MTNAQRKPIALPTDEEEARIQAGIAADPDNPELTDEELAAMRPAKEVLPPALYAALTGTALPASEGGDTAKKPKKIRRSEHQLQMEKALRRARYKRVRRIGTKKAPSKQTA